MTNPIFRPHGNYSARIEGRIVISEIDGPWNLEAVQAWSKLVEPMYTILAATGDPCGGIGVHTASVLTSPESTGKLRELAIRARDECYMVAVAIVAGPEVEGSTLANAILGRVWGDVVPFKVFDNLPDAVQSVEAHVAQAEIARQAAPTSASE